MKRASTYSRPWLAAFGLALVGLHCASSTPGPSLESLEPGGANARLVEAAPKDRPQPTDVPGWLWSELVEDSRVCGIGVAGRAFDWHSDKPKALAEERAAANLAGIFGTLVHESIIATDKNDSASQVELQRYSEVDEGLLDWVKQQAKTEHWLDVLGEGHFAKEMMTYAHSCVDVAGSGLKIDVSRVKALGLTRPFGPTTKPPWLTWIGSQQGARFCAVGFSLPTFFEEESLNNVVDDVRVQLTTAVKTLVMRDFDENTVCTNGRSDCRQFIEDVTGATTDAISKGVVVTHFWFDRDGLGPEQRKRGTYGWGCVYSATAFKKSLEVLEAKLPSQDQKQVAASLQQVQSAKLSPDAFKAITH